MSSAYIGCLSNEQIDALASAAEYCADIWDGDAAEDVAEQDALKAARVALANAEPV